MLIVTDIRNIGRTQADKKFAIVRSLTRPIAGVDQWADLSPSRELFREYLKLRDAGKWNPEAFESIYVPRFLAEMRTPRAQAALAKLHGMAMNSNIAVACFCSDETMCHRHIVASLLAAAGVEVRMKTPVNPRYAELYSAMAA